MNTGQRTTRFPWWDVLLILAISLVAEAGHFSIQQGRSIISGDSVQYVDNAEALLSDGSDPHFALRKPGYSFLLAGVALTLGNMGWAAVAVNHVLQALLPLAAFGLGVCLVARWVGWLAAALTVCRLQTFILGERIMSESLYAALLAFSVLALAIALSRRRWGGWLLLAGTLMGLAWLTRSVAAPLIAVGAVSVLWCSRSDPRRAIASVMILLAPVAASVLLECELNRRYDDRFRPSNGSLGLAMTVRCHYMQGLPFTDSDAAEASLALLPDRAPDLAYVATNLDAWVARHRAIHDHGMTEWDFDALMKRASGEVVVEHPIPYLKQSAVLAGAHLLRKTLPKTTSAVPAERRRPALTHPLAPDVETANKRWFAYWSLPHRTVEHTIDLVDRMRAAAATKAPFAAGEPWATLRFAVMHPATVAVVGKVNHLGSLWPALAIIFCAALGLNRRVCGFLALAYLADAVVIGLTASTYASMARMEGVWLGIDTALAAVFVGSTVTRLIGMAKARLAPPRAEVVETHDPWHRRPARIPVRGGTVTSQRRTHVPVRSRIRRKPLPAGSGSDVRNERSLGDRRRMRSMAPVAGLVVLLAVLGVYRWTLIDRGHFNWGDELCYLPASDLIDSVSRGEFAEAGVHLFEAGRDVPPARPGFVLISVIPTLAQRGVEALGGAARDTVRSFDVASAFNVLVTLGITACLFGVGRRWTGSAWAGLLIAAVYSLLCNANVWIRHLLPYPESLLIFLGALYILSPANKISGRRTAVAGVLSGFAYACYPGHYAFVLINAVVATLRSRSRVLSPALFAIAFVSVIGAFEAAAQMTGRSYLQDLRSLSGTISMGDPKEGFVFLWHYLQDVETVVGIVLLALFLAFAGLVLWRRSANIPPAARIAMVAAIVCYLFHASMGVLLGRMVWYGRVLMMYLPFLVGGAVLMVFHVRWVWGRRILVGSLLAASAVSFATFAVEYRQVVYPADFLQETMTALGRDVTYPPNALWGRPQIDPPETIERFDPALAMVTDTRPGGSDKYVLLVSHDAAAARRPEFICANFKYLWYVRERYDRFEPPPGYVLVGEALHPEAFRATWYEGRKPWERRRIQRRQYKMRIYRRGGDGTRIAEAAGGLGR